MSKQVTNSCSPQLDYGVLYGWTLPEMDMTCELKHL